MEQTGIELQQLAAVAREPEFVAILANPLLSSEARRVITQTLVKTLALRTTTGNFLHVLAQNGRLDQLSDIADQYRRLLDQELNRVRARFISAAPLTERQEEELVTRFERLTGKTVIATTQVDPALLAGIVVEVEGRVYDGSLQTQLTHLAMNIAGSRSHL